MDRDLMAALEQINRRLDNLEATVRRLESSEGKATAAHAIVGAVGNRTDVNFAFLVELLRQNGYLNDTDTASIEAIVREKVAGKEKTWGVSDRTAEENVSNALAVLAGDYDSD